MYVYSIKSEAMMYECNIMMYVCGTSPVHVLSVLPLLVLGDGPFPRTVQIVHQLLALYTYIHWVAPLHIIS